MLAAVIFGEGWTACGLLGDGGGAAVEFEEEGRLHREAEFGIAVDGVDLHLIEQLDPRNGNAGLDRRDDSVDGAVDGLEGAGSGGHRPLGGRKGAP